MSAANQGKTQEYGDPRSSRQVEVSGIVDVGDFTARIRVAHVIGEAASGFAGSMDLHPELRQRSSDAMSGCK